MAAEPDDIARISVTTVKGPGSQGIQAYVMVEQQSTQHTVATPKPHTLEPWTMARPRRHFVDVSSQARAYGTFLIRQSMALRFREFRALGFQSR